MSNLVSLDLQSEDDGWLAVENIESLCERAVFQASMEAQPKPMQGAELSILLTNNTKIRVLNKQWRGIDKPTNVLSFPAVLPEKIAKSPILGDIALAFETIELEAQTDQKSMNNHITHLVIHGFLHILGYDHETEKDAALMEALEISILEKLNIANPYIDCDLLNT